MTPEILNGICQHIDTHSPRKILWISLNADAVPTGLPCLHCLPDSQALTAIQDETFDFSVMADLPAELGQKEAEALLSRMRDVQAQKVFWLDHHDSPWTPRDALALGFHLLQEDGDLKLYGFDIENYKITPDWLNPKNWANPERWDKSRW